MFGHLKPFLSGKSHLLGNQIRTVLCLLNWPWSGNEAGDEIVLLQTSLLLIGKSCFYCGKSVTRGWGIFVIFDDQNNT